MTTHQSYIPPPPHRPSPDATHPQHYASPDTFSQPYPNQLALQPYQDPYTTTDTLAPPPIDGSQLYRPGSHDSHGRRVSHESHRSHHSHHSHGGYGEEEHRHHHHHHHGKGKEERRPTLGDTLMAIWKAVSGAWDKRR